jgi:hypothetical protein
MIERTRLTRPQSRRMAAETLLFQKRLLRPFLASEPLSFPMTPEQEEKLAILKWSLLANLTTVRQARSKENRDRRAPSAPDRYGCRLVATRLG